MSARRGLMLAAGAALLALAGIGGALWAARPSDAGKGAASPAIGGPFRLQSSQGGTLSDADLKGRPFAIFFGFTRCPEVCPTTLWDMSQALERLGPEAERLRVLFVSIDPERDTPESLARYLQAFDPRIVGLSGPPEEVAALARAYRVFWRKVALADGDYTMDHTALVFLMDGQGRYANHIAYGEDAASRDRKLRELLAGASAAAGS